MVTGGAAPVVRVSRGDDVELHWTSDEGATIHLHGYNIETTIPAGGEAVASFRARATGRFPVETHGIGNDHHAEVLLFYLEVRP